ncbi:MAG TPA: 3-oxoacid CoA-transferase subunit A [Candidatus Limnocylindrales bacterium]|nr:3-oxoacid CoA-transferase subunit A [Candidatus Limnocylindrales bacterium]
MPPVEQARSQLDKVVASLDEAVGDVPDGAIVMVGGFGGAGFPFALREALIRRRPQGITIVANNGDFGGLAYEGGLARLICSYPTGATAKPVNEGVEAGRIALQLTPQGTLVERIRAAGAGLGGVLTPTGVGTDFESGYEILERDGRRWLLIPPLHADVALLHAQVADRYGNLVMRHAARNFSPLMAMAARLTIVEAVTIVEPGEIDPDQVHVPSAFVDRVAPLEAS